MPENSEKKTEKNIRVSSFTSRIFFSIFSTSFVLLLLGSLLIYRNLSASLNTLDADLRKSNVENTTELLSQTFAEVDDSAQLVFYQNNALESILKNLRRDTDANKAMTSALNSVLNSNRMLLEIRYLDVYGGMITTDQRTLRVYRNLTEAGEYYSSQKVFTGKDTRWYFLQNSGSPKEKFVIENVRCIVPLPQNRREMPLLVLVLSEQKIRKLYQSYGEDCCIVTPEGVIVSAAKESRIGTLLDGETMQMAKQSGYRTSLLPGSDSEQVFSSWISSLGCYLIIVSRNEAMNGASLLPGIFILVILLGFVLSLFWSRIISKKLTMPLLKLKSTMEKAREGDLSVRADIVSDDEIGYLGGTFNHLMDSLNSRIGELKIQQRLARDSELRRLQSQINPHLLYNTLDSAMFLMSRGNREKSVYILEQMSSYFKQALQKDRKTVTVGNSIRHCRTYLNLQNASRGKEFELEVTGDPKLEDALIMHMLLQPVVENAVLHGFDANFPDGRITVHLEQDGEDLVISVTDDGIGMDEFDLQDLREAIEYPKPGKGGFALWNIVQRMHISYGSRYGIRVESEFGSGTTVRLRLPLQFEEKKQESV